MRVWQRGSDYKSKMSSLSSISTSIRMFSYPRIRGKTKKYSRMFLCFFKPEHHANAAAISRNSPKNSNQSSRWRNITGISSVTSNSIIWSDQSRTRLTYGKESKPCLRKKLEKFPSRPITQITPSIANGTPWGTISISCRIHSCTTPAWCGTFNKIDSYWTVFSYSVFWDRYPQPKLTTIGRNYFWLSSII